MKLILRFFPILTIWLGVTAATVADEVASRQVLSLDGVWSIAEGKMDAPPSTFNRTVPVPGLVTLATPAFTPMPGPKVADRRAAGDRSGRRRDACCGT